MSDEIPDPSTLSMIEATRDRSKFSGHGNALGAAGHREASYDPENCEYLREPGHSIAVSPGQDGFGPFKISASWDNIKVKKPKHKSSRTNSCFEKSALPILTPMDYLPVGFLLYPSKRGGFSRRLKIMRQYRFESRPAGYLTNFSIWRSLATLMAFST